MNLVYHSEEAKCVSLELEMHRKDTLESKQYCNRRGTHLHNTTPDLSDSARSPGGLRGSPIIAESQAYEIELRQIGQDVELSMDITLIRHYLEFCFCDGIPLRLHLRQ